ncbi:MAG: preprotein translocase subunit SecY [Clostridia bacterium]|nr:preprotein translocase subunit SecY [Clostridia bacterium]
MFTTLRNAWKIPELRKKILFTLVVLLLYRLGNCVPVPGVEVANLARYFSQQLSNTVLGLYNVMSGSAFSQATVFALGIQPYINASIIIELLTIAIPALERLAKEGGEDGKKKIQKITRYTTVGLGLLMGFAYFVMLKNYNTQFALLTSTSFMTGFVIVVSFTAGASLLMWLGEQIDEFGIGNGISMILFAGIISRIPSLIGNMVTSLQNGTLTWYWAVLLVIGIVLMMMFIVFITNAERRIPVQYAKRVVGRKMYGGQSTHLPVKVNMSGVLPIIFAQSIASLPATIIAFTGTSEDGFWAWMNKYVFDSKSVIYMVVYFLLIIAFSYFYATIQFNPVEIANNLKKNGGFIPGFRPGKPTADFIFKVINKITLFGALYLAIVALLPIIVGVVIKNSSLAIGGTSVIIVVGVALETVKALEAQMLMRHYKGFLE